MACAKCGSRWSRLDEDGDRVCMMCGFVAVQREHQEPRDDAIDTVEQLHRYIDRQPRRTAMLGEVVSPLE